MKLEGLANALEETHNELLRIEEARAMRMVILGDLIVRAKKIAEAVRGAVAVGRLPELEEQLAGLIDGACAIEAELGLDKLGRVADAFDVPLGGDVPIRGSFGCDVLAEGVVSARKEGT